ncbi:hypothetical protein [Thalassoroseus pseudoceratinae]|uniref:hypothetical protein n=1 Tax=Thalassoroseus pseudoceratinae TaxID=2713176 RepID=UPI00141FAF19|nr:hypothetical protein [Thalassoroseus pseudoceratinae]
MKIYASMMLVAVVSISGCKVASKTATCGATCADQGAVACSATKVCDPSKSCSKTSPFCGDSKGCKLGKSRVSCASTGCVKPGCGDATGKGNCGPASCASTCIPKGATSCTTTCVPKCVSQAETKPQPNPFVQQAAKQPEAAKQVIRPTSSEQPATTAKPAVTQIPAQLVDDAPAYGHSSDYRWLLGVIQKVNTPVATTKVRYARLDEQDAWGGSMVLAEDIRHDEFQDGDVVYVEGQILADRPSLYVSGPLYRANVIRKATSADRIKATK